MKRKQDEKCQERTTLDFPQPPFHLDVPMVFVIGNKEQLLRPTTLNKIVSIFENTKIDAKIISQIIFQQSPGEFEGVCASTFVDHPKYGFVQILFGVISDVASRHNNPARPDQVTKLLHKTKLSTDLAIYLCIESENQAFAQGCAVARAFPLFSRKSTIPPPRKVSVVFWSGKDLPLDYRRISTAAKAVRFAARLVDAPTSEMFTTTMVEEAKKAVSDLPNVEVTVIAGKDLDAKGFGGLFGVGKAAVHPPALVVLSYVPQNPLKKICMVGKGIVYDSGGLSIKDSQSMPGMKRDMAAAAAILAAFVALVETNSPHALHAILCLAENAVGPESTRPDDIHTLHSGKTVEINNTDAEGRLVLADGVSYAALELKPDIILDMATLTGAQGITTGRLHASVVCNDEDMERLVFVAGRESGDLTFPILFAPELLKQEYLSVVADMKNTPKDSRNATSSTAATFIWSHLPDSWKGQWIHVDMASPSHSGENSTGYGVALILQLFKKPI